MKLRSLQITIEVNGENYTVLLLHGQVKREKRTKLPLIDRQNTRLKYQAPTTARQKRVFVN